MTVSPNHRLPLGAVRLGAESDVMVARVGPAAEPARGAAVRSVPTWLPLPDLVSRRGCAEVFFVSTKIDNSGRLADRSAVLEVGWRPGTPVSFSVSDGAKVIVSSGYGQYAITGQGHLRLPAEVRHRCRVMAGVGLLVVVPSERDRLLVYTAAAVTTALSQLGQTPERQRL